MKYRIDGHGRLVLTVTAKERRLLALYSVHDDFDTDTVMLSLFARLGRTKYTDLFALTTSPPLEFAEASEFGDLTSAPILALRADLLVGPIVARWGFMDYQVTSPQRRLMEAGECVWEGGRLFQTGPPPVLSGEVVLSFPEGFDE